MRTDLERARLDKNLTQAQLAHLIGRSQSDVSRYESGDARISIDIAPKIAAALDIHILNVLYGPGSAPPEPTPVITPKPKPPKSGGAKAQSREREAA